MKASKGSESCYSQGLPGSTLGRIILLYLASDQTWKDIKEKNILNTT